MSSDGSKMRTAYSYIQGTHTFFQLQLAESPKALVEEAQKKAKECIAQAYSELMHLNLKDPGYSLLQDLYGQANAEYFKARLAFRRSQLNEGNEALTQLAEAATYFTRCQAHALQVHEALVLPPTGPTDLGLRPFGGDWALWETRIK
jgi:hypothetical protein